MGTYIQNRIEIGIPNGGTMKTQMIASLMDNLSDLPTVEKSVSMPIAGYSCHARELILDHARQAQATHLCMIDADMVFPPNALRRLLEHDKDIIGYNYHERKLPLLATTRLAENGAIQKNETKDLPKGLFQPYVVGFGFILIKMSVFDRLKPPYFTVEHEGKFATEDYTFCRKAQAAGIEVWCDGGITLNHVGDFLY